MNNYCQFELKPLNCIECNKPTPYLGTCKDSTYCIECREQLLKGGNATHRTLIRMAEDNPYWGNQFNDIDNDGRYK